MINSRKLLHFYNCLKKENNLKAPDISDAKKLDFLDNTWADAEIVRLLDLYNGERDNPGETPGFIAGVDEVGRGPMAGPVVAAAVVFDCPVFLPGLNDSKKVPGEVRSLLRQAIEINAADVGVGIVEAQRIDELNILRASLLAMFLALENLKVTPDKVLVDGPHTIPGVNYPQRPIVKGDSVSYSIASASIVAKTVRDEIMVRYDEQYPGYNFSSNKGYCTPDHRAALNKLGPCYIHRKRYSPVKKFYDNTEQLTIV